MRPVPRRPVAIEVSRWMLLCCLLIIGCSNSTQHDESEEEGPRQELADPGADRPVELPGFCAAEPDRLEAFRFLLQASFGPTEREIEEVLERGFAGWIDAQIHQPLSLQLPPLSSLPRPEEEHDLQDERVDIWFHNALFGPDQLRQRIAFALSQIFVVSQVSDLAHAPYALASYYDTLSRHAFGNFRDLMEAVTLHPAMGVYLSMLGNRRPESALNIRSDENYARELMQLFTIGPVKLGIDGSVIVDDSGAPVPTYSQEVIEGFALVFTGWHYANAPSFREARKTLESEVLPMQLYPEFHATEAKLLLNDVVLEAGQTGVQDLRDALDNIFYHSNVAPFIAHRLIQRLVTSNPSPSYIARVASVFEDNGSGVRGDLAAVVKAILLDPEARPGERTAVSGKLKEPLLRLTQLWRAYNARTASGTFSMGLMLDRFGQGPLQAPSVFNFFSPSYAPPGGIRDGGWVAPELEIVTEYLSAAQTNYLLDQVFRRHTKEVGLSANEVVIDIEEEIELASDVEVLVQVVASKLLCGAISPALRNEVIQQVEAVGEANAAGRAGEAIFLVASSPEFAVQY